MAYLLASQPVTEDAQGIAKVLITTDTASTTHKKISLFQTKRNAGSHSLQ